MVILVIIALLAATLVPVITRLTSPAREPVASSTTEQVETIPDLPSNGAQDSGRTLAADDLEILTDPAAAAQLEANRLLDVGRAATLGAWSDLRRDGLPPELPITIARATRGAEPDRIEVHSVTAVRLDGRLDEVVFEVMPFHQSYRAAGTDPEITARIDGQALEARPAKDGTVAFPLRRGRTRGDAVSVELELAFTVPPLDDLSETPGLLGRHGDTVVLGDWIPLLLTTGDQLDLQAYPLTVFSAVADLGGDVATGAVDGPCVPAAEGCVWARSVGATFVPAVTQPLTVRRAAVVEDVGIRVSVPLALQEDIADLSQAAGDALSHFTSLFGPLPWPEVDIVVAPLGESLGGLSVEGFIFIDREVAEDRLSSFREDVVVHEVAHQWFGSIVGSPEGPAGEMLIEAFTQYLTYLYVDAYYGADEAETFAETSLDGYVTRQSNGEVASAPSDTASAEVIDELVYGWAPTGFVAAEQAAGRDAVLELLRGILDDFEFGAVAIDDVLARARAADPRMERELRRYWLEPVEVR